MSKTSLHRKLLGASAFIVCGALILNFQNCAPPEGLEVGSEDFASKSEYETIAHPEPEDPHIPIGEKPKIETTYQPILADRFYLMSVFEDVFGATALTTASVRTLLGSPGEMGSPCSIYEDHYTGTPTGRARNRAMDACSTASPNYLAARALPNPTVIRQALINKACSDLVTSNTTFAFALQRISSEPAPSASAQNLVALFRLFYVAHPAPQEGLIESLQLMFSGPNPAKDEWRAVILTVCSSSQWQVF